MVTVIEGNIFSTRCQTIVNTVNCVGVMGAGLALECKSRYPEMFRQYQALCRRKELDIGMLWLYRTETRWVLNFPTKRNWRNPSREEYLHAGLQKFMETYRAEGITSIAFPLLGARNGGLLPDRSMEIMTEYLKNCTIPVEIYRYQILKRHGEPTENPKQDNTYSQDA